MYILAPNGVIEKYPYSIGELRKDNRQVSFPRKPKDKLLSGYGVYSVAETERPIYDSTIEKLVEGSPVVMDGVWVRSWAVVPLSSEESVELLQSRRESSVLTSAQFRLALLAANELDNVERVMSRSDTPRDIRIMWEYTNHFERLRSPLLEIAATMGYTDEKLDALFGIT